MSYIIKANIDQMQALRSKMVTCKDKIASAGTKATDATGVVKNQCGSTVKTLHSSIKTTKSQTDSKMNKGISILDQAIKKIRENDYKTSTDVNKIPVVTIASKNSIDRIIKDSERVRQKAREIVQQHNRLYTSLNRFGVADESIKAASQNGTIDELTLNSVKARNQAFMSQASLNGQCVNLTLAKFRYSMKQAGAINSSDRRAKLYNTSGEIFKGWYTNGRTFLNSIGDTSNRTDLPFTQTKITGNDCLKRLIEQTGEPITDVIVTFDWGANKNPDGHVMYIDAIVNGKVYYTDSNKPKDVCVKTVDDFISYYTKYNGAPTGVLHVNLDK